MRRGNAIQRVLIASLAIAAGAAVASPPANASSEASAVSTTPRAETGASAAASSEGPDGVIASFRGKRINLAKDGWGDAKICAEFAAGDVRCYADDAAYHKDMGTTPPKNHRQGVDDCPAGWGCIWQHPNFTGRRLQWNLPGTKDLDKWDFRDKASSVANRRPLYGVILVNERWGPIPDQEFICPLGSAYPRLSEYDFDNKADKVKF